MRELRLSVAEADERGGGEGRLPYDPIEWSRRLAEARAARARVLAARESAGPPPEEGPPHRLGEPVAARRQTTTGKTAVAAARAESPARTARALAGFAVGIAVAALLAAALVVAAPDAWSGERADWASGDGAQAN